MDAEYRPPQTERFWKRATKLRAISHAGSRRGPVRQHCRRGKLLPTRRTLLQIDVRGQRRSIVSAVTEFFPPSSSVAFWYDCYLTSEGTWVVQKLDVTRRRPAPHYLFTGETSALSPRSIRIKHGSGSLRQMRSKRESSNVSTDSRLLRTNALAHANGGCRPNNDTPWFV
jgi:hypothetical protein